LTPELTAIMSIPPPILVVGKICHVPNVSAHLALGLAAPGSGVAHSSPGGPEPAWGVIPDLDLLNGSKIPPVMPNIIDIRWMYFPIKVEEKNP
jgi:hypothetical protein